MIESTSHGRCVKASQGDPADGDSDDSDPDDDSGSGAVLRASAQPGGLEVGERTEEGGVSVQPEPHGGTRPLLPSHPQCLYTQNNTDTATADFES